jgi:probable HAF family extracellular repeat protein
MKRSHYIRTLVASAAACALCAVHAQAATVLPAVTMTEIALSPEASVTGLNNQAIVIGNGRVNGEDSPFMTGPDAAGVGPLAGVQIGDVADINDNGVIVGNLGAPDDEQYGLDMHAFMTGPGSDGVIDLGTLGGLRSQAMGINRRGQVVGWSTTAADNMSHAFITDASGAGMHDIGNIGGSCAAANAVNNQGRVVGYACAPGDLYTHAFITDEGGQGMRDLGTLGGHNSAAMALNAAGVVVGWADTGKNTRHAFRTGRNGAGMVDLDPGGHQSQALGINVRGHIVGQYFDQTGTSRAFVAKATSRKFVDLNKLVALPDGAVLMGAVAVNNRDQVVAFASNGVTYLMTHVFEALDAYLDAK